MKQIIISVIAVMMALSLNAQNEIVKIYDGPAPGTDNWPQKETLIDYWSPWGEWCTCLYNTVEPTLTVFTPAPGTETGAAIVVCPGGGFTALSWNTEGPQVGAWFAHHGVTAFVLKYRTAYSGATYDEVYATAMSQYGGVKDTPEVAEMRKKNREIAAQQGDFAKFAADDGRQAIYYVRKNAEKWGIDPHKIGIVGFSAGGMLICDVMKNHTPEQRPDFVGLIYGASRSYEKIIDDPMPLFIAATQKEITPVVFNMYNDWTNANVASEIHSFTGARHGFGYRDNNTGEDLWVEMFLHFMRKGGFIK